MPSLSRLLFVYLINMNTNHAQWTIMTASTPLLPTPTKAQATGFYNDTIYIFGGDHQNEWAEYVISTNTMIYRANQLPYPSLGESQYYTQMNGKLYWITEAIIYSYDFALRDFAQLISVPSPPTLTGYACLTSFNGLLFVLGGFGTDHPLYTVKVLNTSNLQWTIGANLNQKRRNAACSVDTHRGVVFMISGSSNDPVGWRPDYETLDIGDDISQSQWVFYENGLNYGSWSMSAVYVEYNDSILLIGGTGSKGACPDRDPDISIIDCASKRVSAVATSNYPVYDSAIVIVNHVLYSFGGQLDGKSIDTWQRITNPLVLGPHPGRSTTFQPSSPYCITPTITTEDPTNVPTRTPISADPTNTHTSLPSDDGASKPTLVAVPGGVRISSTSNDMLKETVLYNSITTHSNEIMSAPRETELLTAVLVIVCLMVVVGVFGLLWYRYRFKESKTVMI
eukprot:954122_1